MTFNKMRFPIVWITLALCVVLCAIEVQCGPVDDSNNKDLRLASKDNLRTARQEENDGSGQEDGDEEGDGSSEDNDDDGEGGDDESGGDDGSDEEEDEGRSLKRFVREASQKPLLIEEQPDEDSVIPSTEIPTIDVTTKKPSVLLLLSTALDKAIAATTKLPTQQMASDAASVFLLLGQVFSEAIDKVIGDDGPEEGATEIPLTDTTPVEDNSKPQIVDGDHSQIVKVEEQPEINSSQSGVVRFS